MTQRLYPGEETHYLQYRRLGGPRSRSGRVRKIWPAPGFDPQAVQHLASCYTDCTILTSFSAMWTMEISFHYADIGSVGGGNSRNLHFTVPVTIKFNPLNAELNPICHLLVLLGDLNVYGSVHCKYIPIYIQQDATLHSSFISGNCSTCFGWYFHPSSGAHTTVCTASGICHTAHSNQFQLFHDSGR